MYRGKSKILPVILVAIVAVVAIIALVSIGRAILNRDTQPEIAEDPASLALLNTEMDRSVRMTVRGPITADEDFRSYEIEVSPVGRRMTTYRGYQNQVIEDVRLGNSNEAYTELVHALSLANFTKTAQSAVSIDDIAGVCATGRVYTFELRRAQSAVKQLWATSCRGVDGSFKGNAAQVRDLLQGQIPNSRDLLRGINL